LVGHKGLGVSADGRRAKAQCRARHSSYRLMRSLLVVGAEAGELVAVEHEVELGDAAGIGDRNHRPDRQRRMALPTRSLDRSHPARVAISERPRCVGAEPASGVVSRYLTS